ncbi:hypothetical protein [Candidatus Reidiella endopervernicosa]|uniref:Uncharacterized protein n=1 Tax=Candidatus Reidiella endopervernicosa TaxID=2738883 RepID=A0A6N0HZ16_9GAMM|nr:hypothetical protein [Candidatus Reidiella endopervernicosa]QKQ27630.1 hypothetical protein HUE57_16035 [Candidatus Reidiella endopervernicosa]
MISLSILLPLLFCSAGFDPKSHTKCRHKKTHAPRGRGVAIFAKVCFGHPSPSKQQNLTRPFMPTAPRPSCVRCVITSSRLYTTPSVTLRRHKAAAASSSSSLALSTTNMQGGVDYRGLTALTSLSMAVSGSVGLLQLD